MQEDFQLRTNSMHEQIKEDYAIELQEQKEIISETTVKQQQLIEKQAEELKTMKQRLSKRCTMNLQVQDETTETIQELEERNEEAERRVQDLEIKVRQLGKSKNTKIRVAPPGPPDDDYDHPLNPDDFSEGSYHGDDEDEEEESEQESASDESVPEPPTPVPLTRKNRKSSAREGDASQTESVAKEPEKVRGANRREERVAKEAERKRRKKLRTAKTRRRIRLESS